MRHNWLAVARKDVADAGRSWLLYALAGVLMGIFAVIVFGLMIQYDPPTPPGEPAPPAEPHVRDAYGSVLTLTSPLVPLIALAVGYLAVAGEREAGTLRMLLGHPVERWEVLLGKTVGRTTVLSAALLVALGAAGLGLALFYRAFDPVTYVAFVAMFLLLGLSFLGVAVGISAAAPSRAVSLAGVITTYVVTTFAWDVFPDSLYLLLNGDLVIGEGRPPYEAPEWFVFLRRLRPQRAFKLAYDNYVTSLHMGDLPLYVVAGPDPFYVTPAFDVVVLLAWFAVPLAIGYWRFQSVDV